MALAQGDPRGPYTVEQQREEKPRKKKKSITPPMALYVKKDPPYSISIALLFSSRTPCALPPFQETSFPSIRIFASSSENIIATNVNAYEINNFNFHVIPDDEPKALNVGAINSIAVDDLQKGGQRFAIRRFFNGSHSISMRSCKSFAFMRIPK
eukprot:Gb_01069 [translate_table: standard]